jgi:hypothetical protein
MKTLFLLRWAAHGGKPLNFKLLVATLALCGFMQAGTPVIQGLWHLGEADAGAANDVAGNATTVDSSGNGNTLTLVGSPAPTYSSFAAQGSSLSMLFSGNSNYSGASINTGTDNFGIEIWAYATGTGGNRAVIYNGNTGTAGYGIYQVGSNWALLYGGRVLSGVAPLTLNQWTDLALVRDAGATTMYINGIAFPLAVVAPNAITGNMLIGASQTGGERFIGNLDEARLFTFSGGFSPTVLYANSIPATPAPSSLLLILTALACLGLFAAWRSFTASARS